MNGPAREPVSGRTAPHLRHRRIRDQSLVLLIAGVVLFMPPAADIFRLDGHIAGVPATLAYLFVVWAGLIAGALILSRRLRESDDPTRSAEEMDRES